MAYGSSSDDDRPRVVSEKKKEQSPVISTVSKVLKIILAQWLAIGFGLSCLLAYFFPSE